MSGETRSPALGLTPWLDGRGPLARLFAGPLLSRVLMVAVSAIIPVGPWLVSVLALSVISITLDPVLGSAAIEDIRIAVVYAFGLALVATAPVATLTARLARRAVEAGDAGRLPNLYLACLCLAGFASQAFALCAALVFGFPDLRFTVAFALLTTTAAMLWTSFAVLSALKRHWLVFGAFSFGTAVAVACALASAAQRPSVEILLWSFALGLAISHHMMFAGATAGLTASWAGLRAAFAAIRGELTRHGLLFFGVLFAMLAVWADKTVFWFGPDGMEAHSGLAHFAPYDSAMFIAHLSMIPSFASWYLFQQSELEPRVERLWRRIGERPTYAQLAGEAAALQELIWSNIFRILFVQAAFSVVIVMLAPQIVRGLSMSTDQIELLQIGALAVLLQSLFFLCSAVIMLCNRPRAFFRLNAAFLATALGFGLVAEPLLGVTAYPILAASLICAAASFLVAYRAAGEFLFAVFVLENDGLYAEPKPIGLPTGLLRAPAGIAARLRGGANDSISTRSAS